MVEAAAPLMRVAAAWAMALHISSFIGRPWFDSLASAGRLSCPRQKSSLPGLIGQYSTCGEAPGTRLPASWPDRHLAAARPVEGSAGREAYAATYGALGKAVQRLGSQVPAVPQGGWTDCRARLLANPEGHLLGKVAYFAENHIHWTERRNQ
jgi:hypothetical protein